MVVVFKLVRQLLTRKPYTRSGKRVTSPPPVIRFRDHGAMLEGRVPVRLPVSVTRTRFHQARLASEFVLSPLYNRMLFHFRRLMEGQQGNSGCFTPKEFLSSQGHYIQ